MSSHAVDRVTDPILALVNALVLAVVAGVHRFRGIRRRVVARHRVGLVVPVGPGWRLTYRFLCLETPYGRRIARSRHTAERDVATWVACRRRVAELRELAATRRAESGWAWLDTWSPDPVLVPA